LKPIQLVQFGKIVKISSKAIISNKIDLKVGQRMLMKAHKIFEKQFGKESDINYEMEVIKETKSLGNGTSMIVTCYTSTGGVLSGTALGAKGLTAEKIGKTASRNLLYNITKGGCVDEYGQDQLIIFAALAAGTSRFRTGPITSHTQAAIYFAQLLTGASFTISKTTDRQSIAEKSYIIECKGVGLVNKQRQC